MLSPVHNQRNFPITSPHFTSCSIKSFSARVAHNYFIISSMLPILHLYDLNLVSILEDWQMPLYTSSVLLILTADFVYCTPFIIRKPRCMSMVRFYFSKTAQKLCNYSMCASKKPEISCVSDIYLSFPTSCSVILC
jgi:hypothetical protein